MIHRTPPARHAPLEQKKRDPRCTCNDCRWRDTCQYAYDGYNFDGDCLDCK